MPAPHIKMAPFWMIKRRPKQASMEFPSKAPAVGEIFRRRVKRVL